MVFFIPESETEVLKLDISVLHAFNVLASAVEPHYYNHLWAKHFWLLYKGGCFTEVQMY